MLQYQIKRWDVILIDGKRIPIVYFIPDDNLFNHFQKSAFVTACIIQDTGMQYDGHIMLCSVDKSSMIPNFRPNFFEETGLYVATLQSSWNGYPRHNNLGNVSFVDLE